MQFVGGGAWLEIFHYLGIALWFGSVAMLDFRLMGFSSKVPVRAFHLSAGAYIGFVLTLATGLYMFIPHAGDYLHNPMFLLKLAFLTAAILVGVFFNLRHVNDASKWAGGVPTPAARLSGLLSLLLWLGVLVAGRLIAYSGFTQG